MKTATKARVIVAQLWIWLLFCVVYAIMNRIEPDKHFGKNFNPAYFAAVTQTTLGSKTDPRTMTAQFVVVCHVVSASIVAVAIV